MPDWKRASARAGLEEDLKPAPDWKRVSGRAVPAGKKPQPGPDRLGWPLARAVEEEGRAGALAERLARAADEAADGPADEADRPADEVAAPVPVPDGLAPVLVRAEPGPDGRPGPDGLAAPELAPPGLAAAEPVVAFERGGAGLVAPAVADGRVVWSAGAVDGLNVATDSIAPATRHTARMLASSGMTVPGPENGLVSRCSRFLRRCARSSRW